jgi:heat shock protein beta
LHRYAEAKEIEEEYKGLTDWMAETLGSKVEKVAVSKRLTDTPCILVTSKFGWSANMAGGCTGCMQLTHSA